MASRSSLLRASRSLATFPQFRFAGNIKADMAHPVSQLSPMTSSPSPSLGIPTSPSGPTRGPAAFSVSEFFSASSHQKHCQQSLDVGFSTPLGQLRLEEVHSVLRRNFVVPPQQTAPQVTLEAAMDVSVPDSTDASESGGGDTVIGEVSSSDEEDDPIIPTSRGTSPHHSPDTPHDPGKGDAPTTQEEGREVGGPSGPEPTRYGDWEKAGRCYDF